jgi:hypothetical protein
MVLLRLVAKEQAVETTQENVNIKEESQHRQRQWQQDGHNSAAPKDQSDQQQQ